MSIDAKIEYHYYAMGSGQKLLRECRKTWGEAHQLEAVPSLRQISNAVYVPFNYGACWGIFDDNLQIVEESLDYRGPEKILAGQITEYDEKIRVEQSAADDMYIYFGRINLHYGHFIINSLPRFWPLLTIDKPIPKILVHGSSDEWSECAFFKHVIGCLGLSIEDLNTFDKPTRINALIVPETSLREQLSVHKVYGGVCQLIGSRVQCDKINIVETPVYFSKTRLKRGVGHFSNEQIIVDGLSSAGVEISFPEELEFAAQIRLWSERQLCTGTTGSAFHTSIFAAPHRQILGLNPTHDVNSNYVLLDHLHGNNARYFFPEGTTYSHAAGDFMTTIHAPAPEAIADELLSLLEQNSDWRRKPTAAPFRTTHNHGETQGMINYEHRGASYLELLHRFHKILNPQTYLEIGTLNGSTLELAACPTICVDPNFQLNVSATSTRPFTMFFQQTSDRFFEQQDATRLFGRPVELAFLDGLHEAETLLRDFINVERHCKPNSIISMHDCVPMNVEMTVRQNTGGFWTGDVWKIIPILREYRPDIDLFVFDAGPTGLVCCTGLDAKSTVIADNWGKIWRDWRNVELSAYGFERLIQCAGIIWTEKVKTGEDMRRYFWL